MKRWTFAGKLSKGAAAITLAALALIAAALAVFAVRAARERRLIDYVITDMGKSVLVRSESQDPEAVLLENNVDMTCADFDVVIHDGVRELIVDRTSEVTLDLFGVERRVTVLNGTTAGALLRSLNVELTENDAISCALTAVVYESMEISVTRTVYEYETTQSLIPAPEKRIDSPYMIAGREKVMVEGADGVMETRYILTYINGELKSREVASMTVLSDPVERIIAEGSRESAVHAYNVSVDVPEPANGVVTTLNGETLSYTSVLDMRATAYTYDVKRPWMDTTSSGVPVQVGVVAAKPYTLPQGTLVYICAADGSWEYGVAIVGDKPGGDLIDLFMEDYDECMQFGSRKCKVYILG